MIPYNFFPILAVRWNERKSVGEEKKSKEAVGYEKWGRRFLQEDINPTAFDEGLTQV